MSNQDEVVVTATISEDLRDRFRAIAIKEKRSMTRHLAWLIQRHVEAKESDAA
jgi:hypothetical protein